jgi:low temperature requirement protein LtrA
MKGIALPPLAEDFSADPVELFFDLGYVLAFSQLVGHLVHHPDARGVGGAALLFLLMWLPWSQFTWSANAVSGNGRPVRLLFLVATALTVPMAASVSTAFAGGGPVFALALGTIHLIGLATIALGVDGEAEVRRSLGRWAALSGLGLAVLVAGAFAGGALRVAAWGGAIAIFLLAMHQAGRGEWIVRAAHFAERHGLIVIIALGEVVVAIGAPVVAALEAGAGLAGLTALALVASGAFACLVWWAYFDRFGVALEHRAARDADGRTRGRYVRDVYTLAHAPIVAGVVLVAAALEEIALHPGDPIALGWRAMFGGGLALVTAGMAGAVWRAYRLVVWERVAGAAATMAVIAATAGSPGVAVLVAVDAILGVLLAVEHVRKDG